MLPSPYPPVREGDNLAVPTRYLIIASLVTALVILAAAVLWFLRFLV